MKVSSATLATRSGPAGTGGAGLTQYPERWQWQPQIGGHEKPPILLGATSAIGAGGAVASGTALVAKIKALVAAGGIVASGAATTGQLSVKTYVPAGGVVCGGAAATSPLVTRAYTASGEATTGGTAATSFLGGSTTWIYAPSGGADCSGTAECSYTAGTVAKPFQPSIFFSTAPALSVTSPAPWLNFPHTYEVVGRGSIGHLMGWGGVEFVANDDEEVLTILELIA